MTWWLTLRMTGGWDCCASLIGDIIKKAAPKKGSRHKVFIAIADFANNHNKALEVFFLYSFPLAGEGA